LESVNNIGYKKLNRLLLAVIVVINVYVIAQPLYPEVVYWWQTHVHHRQQALAQAVKSTKKTKANPQPAAIPAGEHLVIPSIALDQNIVEGQSIYTVNKGVWRWPKSSDPTKSGNMVLIGHRFTYAGPAVFAHLDLVKVGDPETLYWNGKQFDYKVSQIKVVDPNDTSIIQPTDDTRLTIYTCTPMWSTKFRLAVIAEQEKT